MSYGYSQRIVEANRKAASGSLGVALGRFCIARDIPVARVADDLGVSRMTIYKWMAGDTEPSKERAHMISKWMQKHNKRRQPKH